MAGAGFKIGCALLCGFLLVQATPAFSGQRHPEHKRAAKQEQPAPPAQPATPPGPLVPLTLAQTPANPPQVSYQNGELTINAQNSTLGDILRAVRAQTGADIDVPPNASERVVSHFGPGPARQVLSELLDGSHFNYVMTGSPSDANVLQRVILTPKAAGSEQVAAQSQPPVPINSPPPQAASAAQAMADDDDADTSTDDLASPPSNSSQPVPAAGQPVIKTPEQLLQELQRQQQIGRAHV